MLKAIAQQRGSRLAIAAGLLGLAAPVFVFVRLAFFTNPVVAQIEMRPLSPLAWAAAYAVPCALVLLGAAGRPSLYAGAAILWTLAALSAMSGVLLPLLVPAGLAVAALVRARRGPAYAGRTSVATAVSAGRAALAAALPVVLAIAAFVVLMAARGPTVCWAYVELRDGTRIYERDVRSERDAEQGGGSQTLGPLQPGQVSSGGGCTEAVTRPAQSAAALLLSAGAVAIARVATRKVEQHKEPA